MPVNYIDFKQAKEQSGLRMVVVEGLPSPWSEAAKGILHVKKIPWHAVYLDPRNSELTRWARSHSAPSLIYNDEPSLSGWEEILLFAERLTADPALLPLDPHSRTLALQLGHQICGEMGLGWCRRLESVHKGIIGTGGFPKPIALYLASKYGYEPEKAEEYTSQVIRILNTLAKRLHQQRNAGSSYYFGATLSVIDIYSATFMAYFQPIPHEQCQMQERIRTVFESLDEPIATALDPILLKHRDFIYNRYLELPLSL